MDAATPLSQWTALAGFISALIAIGAVIYTAGKNGERLNQLESKIAALSAVDLSDIRVQLTHIQENLLIQAAAISGISNRIDGMDARLGDLVRRG